MNTTIKLGIASALAFGAVAAHASISVPSTGASDAILFAEVLNASGSAIASYAGDTGVSVSSLLNGTAGTQLVLGGDANLAKLFTADGSGDTLEWAVQGGQYTGGATTGNFGPTGNAEFITTTTTSSSSHLATDTTANLINWGKLSTVVGTVNTNSGGANSVESGSPSTGGVWDATSPSNNISGWYNSAPTANVLGAATQSLFSVTGGGGVVAHVAYATLGTTASLSSSGLQFTTGTGTPPPPVPLPAAIWLLGSGLLGLTGVARRKLKV